jgi:hypothetical protein
MFDLFKILYMKEQKAQKLKGAILKIYCALQVIYKTTIIPVIRWSFNGARFRLNSDISLLSLLSTGPNFWPE